MSDTQTTRPDPPGPVAWPAYDPPPPVRPEPVRGGRRIVRAFGAVLGVQALVAFAVLLVLNSYRRSAAGWLLPLIGVADVAATLQICWLAIRDIRLLGGRTAAPRLLLTALVLLLAAGLAGGAYAIHRHTTAPVRGALGTPVQDGDLTFTASSPRCGVKIKGIAATGAWCSVRLTAANTGSAPLRLDAAAQRVRGGDGARSGSLLLSPSRSKKKYVRAASRPLPAGSSFSGYLLFDVPPGFAARALELHAAGGSRGVRIEIEGA
ncbi:DUF4352 domain-containing protein [Actinomadura nitritigenes]|uniref:DUF4352 domain-containing protein n=1 Tax=Actinomadura nitritigenes TaxID=134602 RepID=UPI003D8B128E